jgi:hypothetical protein
MVSKDNCISNRVDGRRCTKKKVCGSEYCSVHRPKPSSLQEVPPFKLNDIDCSSDSAKHDVAPIVVTTETESIKAVTEHVMSVETDKPHAYDSSCPHPNVDSLTQAIADMNIQFQRQCMLLNEKMNVLEHQQKVQAHAQTLVKKKSYAAKAKMLYYHEQKTTEGVKDVLRERLKSCQLYHCDKSIPWILVKQWTDFVFDQLPDGEKAMYEEIARYTHEAKKKAI